MNRPDISRLNKNRGIYLKIGLMASLCMVIFAFNFTVYEFENAEYKAGIVEQDIIDPVVRTIQINKPKPLPPVITSTDDILSDEQNFVEEQIPKAIDLQIKVDAQQIRPTAPVIINTKPKPPKIISVENITNDVPDFFEVVEEMPRFPGCEDLELTKKEKKVCADQSLLKYIYSNIKYPKLARMNRIEGVVVLGFIVEKTGEISNIKILQEIGGGCGTEVVRVVNGMPKWIPGKQRGREVRVRYKMPIKFKLQ